MYSLLCTLIISSARLHASMCFLLLHRHLAPEVPRRQQRPSSRVTDQIQEAHERRSLGRAAAELRRAGTNVVQSNHRLHAEQAKRLAAYRARDICTWTTRHRHGHCADQGNGNGNREETTR